MAKETVKAVRNAELVAAQKEKDALQKKEAILIEAQQNAKSIITSMTKEAQQKAERDLKEAEKKASDILENAREQAGNEILLLKEMVKSKEQAAIDLILSNVV